MAGQQVTLSADHDILVQGGQNTDSQHSDSSSSSAGIGVAIGLGSKGGFAGVNVNAAGSRGNSDGSDVTQTLSTITAGGTVTINSGNDVTLKSAQVSGNQVIANVGHDLNIISVQDTSTYDSNSQSAGGSVTIGPASSGSASYAQSKVNADFASVGQQTGIEAGDGGFQINVKGNTDLQGGKISSTQAAIDSNSNILTTGTLTNTGRLNSIGKI